MINKLINFFKSFVQGMEKKEEKKEKDNYDYFAPFEVSSELQLAVTVLLVELSTVDKEIACGEGEVIVRILSEVFGINDEEVICNLVAEAVEEKDNKSYLSEQLELIHKNFTEKQKISLVAMLWRVILADGNTSKKEEGLLERMRQQLRISQEDLEKAKKIVEEKFA